MITKLIVVTFTLPAPVLVYRALRHIEARCVAFPALQMLRRVRIFRAPDSVLAFFAVPSFGAGFVRSYFLSLIGLHDICRFICPVHCPWPKQSPEPTAVGAKSNLWVRRGSDETVFWIM